VADFPEFAFRPAPMRPEYVWAVKEGHVMRRGGPVLKLGDVTSAQWGDVSYRGTRSAWLDLQSGSDQIRLECSDAGLSRDRAHFIDLILAVLAELDRHHQDLGIRYDSGGPFSRALFVLGVVLTLVGGGLAYAGLRDLSTLPGWALLGVGAGLIGGCSLLAWIHRPWRPSAVARPAELRTLLTLQEGRSA
jgi:hypothetical protein